MTVDATGTAVLAVPGASLVYQVAGRGPAVVLVHGFSLDMRMWDRQFEPLSARYRVVRYDLRGFGASGPFATSVPYTHAEDLVALLDHLGIADAVLVGLSFGGQVAVAAAATVPARVRGLALLDSLVDGVKWDAESARGSALVARRVSEGGVLAGRAAWLAHPLFAAARNRPEVAGELAEMVAGYPGQHWLGQDPHRRPERPIVESLETIAVPTLVAVGEFDVPGFREMSALLADRISGAEHHVIRAAGHMINMEQPEKVNRILLRFLDGIDSNRSLPAGGQDELPGGGQLSH